jgi:hypothetical protein
MELKVWKHFLEMDEERAKATQGREENDFLNGGRESTRRHAVICPITLPNTILLLEMACCLIVKNDAVVDIPAIFGWSLSSLELAFLGIAGLIMVKMKALKIERRRLSPPNRARFALFFLKLFSVMAFVYAIKPTLPEDIAGCMGYFTLVEMARHKAERRNLWNAYLCPQIFMFFCIQEITDPEDSAIYEWIAKFELFAW